MEEDAPDAKAIAKRISVLARDVHSPDVERRRASAQEIYDLCYKAPDLAKSALPALMDFLCDSDEKVGDSALWGLKYCAPDSIEPLIECLAHRDAKVRERASHSLGNIGDEAITAGDALRGLLDDPTQAVRVRELMVRQLKELATMTELVPHLASMRKTLRGGRTEASEMCEVLASLGPKAAPAVPDLVQLLQEER